MSCNEAQHMRMWRGGSGGSSARSQGLGASIQGKKYFEHDCVQSMFMTYDMPIY